MMMDARQTSLSKTVADINDLINTINKYLAKGGQFDQNIVNLAKLLYVSQDSKSVNVDGIFSVDNLAKKNPELLPPIINLTATPFLAQILRKAGREILNLANKSNIDWAAYLLPGIEQLQKTIEQLENESKQFSPGQKFILDPIISLDRPDEDLERLQQGVCFGLREMLVAACLVGNFDLFMLRIQIIKATDIKVFKDYVNKAEALYKDFYKDIDNQISGQFPMTLSSSHKTKLIHERMMQTYNAILKNENVYDIKNPSRKLDDREKELLLFALLEIHVFIENALLHQSPENYSSELFGPSKNIKIYQNIEVTSPITMSSKLEEQGGMVILPVFSPLYNMDTKHFSCTLYNKDKKNQFAQTLKSLRAAFEPVTKKVAVIKDEIKALQRKLAQSENADDRTALNKKLIELKENQYPVALRGSNNGHSIAIIFDADANLFMFADTNNYPPKVMQDNVVESKLTSSFSKNGITTFQLSVAVTKAHQDEYQNYIKEWQGSNEWTELYATVTPEEAKQQDSRGMTRLCIAAVTRQTEVAKLLLAAGADVNQKTTQGTSPLHFAVQDNNLDMLSLLLANGADVNSVADKGVTAIYTASLLGYREIVDILLTCTTIDLDLPVKESTTFLLKIAKQHDRVKEMKELLTDKSELHAKIKPTLSGFTPLFAAVIAGHTEVVKSLLQKGADVKRTVEGLSALDFAKAMNHVEIIQLLETPQKTPQSSTNP